MAYLLELQQDERQQFVGVFDDEPGVFRFIESIPFAQRAVDPWGVSYSMPFADIPELHRVSYRGWVYMLSRSSFSAYPSAGDVSFVWREVQDFDSHEPEVPTISAGTIPVDAYSFPMAEAAEQIEKREQLFAASEDYFGALGQSPSRGGLGSQDGEYVEVTRHFHDGTSSRGIAFLLDPAAVSLWEESADFAEFLGKLIAAGLAGHSVSATP